MVKTISQGTVKLSYPTDAKSRFDLFGLKNFSTLFSFRKFVNPWIFLLPILLNSSREKALPNYDRFPSSFRCPNRVKRHAL